MNVDRVIKNMNADQVMEKQECLSSDKKARMAIKWWKSMNADQMIRKHEFLSSDEKAWMRIEW